MRLLLLLILSAGCRQLLGFEEPATVGIDGPAATPDAESTLDASVDAASPSQVADALLRQWSGCMSQANLSASGLAPAWANLSVSGGSCKTCHEDGQNGFIATINETKLFTALSTNKFFMLQFFTVDFNQEAIVINLAAINAVATAQAPHQQHPTFAVPNAGTTALQTFFNATAARRDAGTCDPPRLMN